MLPKDRDKIWRAKKKTERFIFAFDWHQFSCFDAFVGIRRMPGQNVGKCGWVNLFIVFSWPLKLTETGKYRFIFVFDWHQFSCFDSFVGIRRMSGQNVEKCGWVNLFIVFSWPLKLIETGNVYIIMNIKNL